MRFNRVSQTFSLLVTIGFLLSACGGGGGGGGGGSSSPKTPTTTAFPVAQAYAQLIINGVQANVTLSGKISGANVTGSGTYQLTAATAGTFENQAGLRNNESYSVTVVANGQSAPASTTTQVYYDSNYNQIGEIDSDAYIVATAPFALPAAAHVNDSGNLGSATSYTDSSKSSVQGTATLTYKIESDSATSIIFVVTAQQYDTGHALTETDVYRYRVTDTGIATFLSINFSTADGDQLKFTMQ